MKRLSEMLSGRRHEFLGGKTMAENAAAWREKWEKGEGALWRYGPGTKSAETATRTESATGPDELRLHLGRCGVPDNLAKLILGGLEERQGVTVAKDWLGSDAHFLVFSGKTGTGKSVAAAAVVAGAKKTVRWQGGEREMFDSAGCAFESAVELSRFGVWGDDARAYWGHIGRTRLLILDDMGAETMSAPWLSNLDGLLNERFGRAGCRTVLTTNISTRRAGVDAPSPFEERYGARIARRIRDSGRVVSL